MHALTVYSITDKAPKMQQNTPKRGRPEKPPAEKLIQRSARLPPDLWEKVDDNGGQEWLRRAVRESKVPAVKP